MVDSGADTSTVQEGTVRQLRATNQTKSATSQVSGYSGASVPVLGKLELRLHHKDTTHNAKLMVVPDHLPQLVGLDLIKALRLNIRGADLCIMATTGAAKQASVTRQTSESKCPPHSWNVH